MCDFLCPLLKNICYLLCIFLKPAKLAMAFCILILFFVQIYRLVAICLGIPAKTFDWEYYDKNKKYHCIKGITPYDFYHSHIKPIFNLKDKVGLSHSYFTYLSYSCSILVPLLISLHFLDFDRSFFHIRFALSMTQDQVILMASCTLCSI